jgi:hypothetical protein
LKVIYFYFFRKVSGTFIFESKNRHKLVFLPFTTTTIALTKSSSTYSNDDEDDQDDDGSTTTTHTNTDKATLRVIGVCGLVVAVGLGVVSFLISSNDHRRLHPWMLISCQLSAY